MLKGTDLPPDVLTLVKVAYFLVSKAVPVRAGEEREIIAYRVPVREFERLRAKSDLLQAALFDNEGGDE